MDAKAAHRPLIASLRAAIMTLNGWKRALTAMTAGGDPYRRKTVSFATTMDRAAGSEIVKVKQIGRDRSDFQLVYEPSHPAADEKGYVKRPNVQPLIEMMDMREASRSFEASVNVIEQSRTMMSRMIDLLRG